MKSKFIFIAALFSEEDFAKKQYAQDKGHCQPLEKVPFPLPKIAK